MNSKPGRFFFIILLFFILSLLSACGGGSSSSGSDDASDDDSHNAVDDDVNGDDDDNDDDNNDDNSDDDDLFDDDSGGSDDDTYMPPDGFEVIYFDVGQGDSFLLRFPAGSTMLIDGGPNDQGYDTIIPYFHNLHLKHLNYMVSTHPHADHCGGLDEVIYNVEVDEVWENGETNDTGSWSDFVKAVANSHIPVTIMKRGDTQDIDGCNVLVLSSNQGYTGDEELNANSMVLSVSCENQKFLFTADITEEPQNDLISIYGNDLKSDVVKVPHHGSPDRAQDFPQYVLPSYAVISVGQPNDYGHPSAQVIQEWEDVGATVYRTDNNGTVKISAKNGELTTSTEH